MKSDIKTAITWTWLNLMNSPHPILKEMAWHLKAQFKTELQYGKKIKFVSVLFSRMKFEAGRRKKLMFSLAREFFPEFWKFCLPPKRQLSFFSHEIQARREEMSQKSPTKKSLFTFLHAIGSKLCFPWLAQLLWNLFGKKVFCKKKQKSPGLAKVDNFTKKK